MHSEPPFYSMSHEMSSEGMSFLKNATEKSVSNYKMIIFIFLFMHLYFA